MAKVTWEDTKQIGLELADRYPEMDPVPVSPEELRRMVTELEGFEDDPTAGDAVTLSVIRQRWLEAFLALQE